MRGYAIAAAAAGLVLGCGKTGGGERAPATAAATPFDGPAILRFSVVHFEGSYRFTVSEDGKAEYASAQGPSLREAKALASTATPDEIRAVMKVLKANDFCSLTASNRPGVPDEARPTIDVHSDGLACSVTMWDGEFSDNPKARACLGAVEALGRSIKGRAEP